MSELEANTPHDNQEDKSFDVEFGVPFEDLRRHMAIIFLVGIVLYLRSYSLLMLMSSIEG